MPFIDHKPPQDIAFCDDPEHKPPAHIVLPPGEHVWQCPSCGKITRITIPAKPTVSDKWQSQSHE